MLSFTLREEYELSVLKNKGLWKMFGTKRDEVREESRILCNEDHNLYRSPSVVRTVKSRW
jgi:hypothetical protein